MTPERTLLQEAEDPSTLPRRLVEIVAKGRISAAAEAVAAHPNAAPSLLETLVRSYPKAVLRNPTLPLVLLEDPGWAGRLRPEAALELLRFENVPAGLLSALAGRPGPVGQAARLHVGMAGEAGPDWETDVREALWDVSGLADREEAFPARLLSLALVPEWLTEPLAAHGDAQVRRAVARSLRTSPGSLTLLRRAGSTSDLGGPAPPDLSLPVPVLERLARGGPWARRLAARHPNTPPGVLEALAQGKDETLCRHLVRNPSAPAALRASLAVSLGPVFRQASARDPETLPGALAVLASDEVRDVRWMAARNPGTPQTALETLARDADARVRQGVGRNAAVSADLLTALARDPVRWVRLAAARHPQTPPDTLTALAEDADEEVRQAVARRSRPVSHVNRSPKPQSSLPAPPRIRTQPDVDPAEKARALDEAARSIRLLAKTAVLACPDVSPKYLAGAVTSPLWPHRLAVARNPAAVLVSLEQPGSEPDLHRLAQDGNRLVRAAARAALQKRGTGTRLP